MGLKLRADGDGTRHYLREGTYRVNLQTLGTARDSRGRYLFLEFSVVTSTNPALRAGARCVHVCRLPPTGWGRMEGELWELAEACGYERGGLSLFITLRDLKENCLLHGGQAVGVTARIAKTRAGRTFARLAFAPVGDSEFLYSNHEDGCEDGEEGECSEYDS